MKVNVNLEFEFDSVYESQEDVVEFVKYILGLDESISSKNNIYSSRVKYEVTKFELE